VVTNARIARLSYRTSGRPRSRAPSCTCVSRAVVPGRGDARRREPPRSSRSTPVVIHDADERCSRSRRRPHTPRSGAAATSRPARLRAAPCRRERAGPGCSTGSTTRTRTRTAGSSAPAAHARRLGARPVPRRRPTTTRSRPSTRSTARAERCGWDEVELSVSRFVYAAHGSPRPHISTRARATRLWPDPNDEGRRPRHDNDAPGSSKSLARPSRPG
jgi:hypothetical protein